MTASIVKLGKGISPGAFAPFVGAVATANGVAAAILCAIWAALLPDLGGHLRRFGIALTWAVLGAMIYWLILGVTFAVTAPRRA